MLSKVCFHMCALICVFSYVCSHMCALICVLSYVCSRMCAPIVLIRVLSKVCSRMCAPIVLICVLSYVCSSHRCGLMMLSPFFPIPPTTLFGVSCRDNSLLLDSPNTLASFPEDESLFFVAGARLFGDTRHHFLHGRHGILDVSRLHAPHSSYHELHSTLFTPHSALI